MPEVICDTSPLQYLYQLELLHILPALSRRVLTPPAVVEELAQGRALGIRLPDVSTLEWITVRPPVGKAAVALVTDLGPGETEVLMLGLESREAVIVLDDGRARRVADARGLHFTGTLGLLVDAKRAGLISTVAPFLDRLQALRFRVAPYTYDAVLKLAGE